MSISAHAKVFGGDHEHDGVACAVDTAASEDPVVLPNPDQAAEFTLAPFTRWDDDYTSVLRLLPQGRAPPPRGPPSFIL